MRSLSQSGLFRYLFSQYLSPLARRPLSTSFDVHPMPRVPARLLRVTTRVRSTPTRKSCAMPHATLLDLDTRAESWRTFGRLDVTIIDTMHTDLIDNMTGVPRAKSSDFIKWCAPDIKHLMLNRLRESGRCFHKGLYYRRESRPLKSLLARLETFSASEWEDIPAPMFTSLKTVGLMLKGIHLMTSSLKRRNLVQRARRHDCSQPESHLSWTRS